MNQIPEEIRNILFPEFLMKELSKITVLTLSATPATD